MTDRTRSMHSLAMAASVNAAPTFMSCGAEERASPAAFRRLYDEHAPVVWRVIRRLGLAEDLVEDALQEVFLIAFRRQADFEGRSAYRTWLCGIAVRVARRARSRAARRAGREVREPTGDHSPSRGDLPDGLALRREAITIAERILEGMEATRREVFVLLEVEQLPGPEVASILGVPLNTVYSRLRLARADFARAARSATEREREAL